MWLGGREGDSLTLAGGRRGSWAMRRGTARVAGGAVSPRVGWAVSAAAAGGAVGVHAFTALTDASISLAVRDCLGEDYTGVRCPTTAASYGHMADWNTSLVTNMRGLFNRGPWGPLARTFNVDLSGWDTSQVTNMAEMFRYAEYFDADLSAWDTSQVRDMRSMFEHAYAFNASISQWDTSQVVDMQMMFLAATDFNSDLSGWNTGQVTDMSYTFQSAYSFNGDVPDWDTSVVTTMTRMFSHSERFTGNVSTWDTSQVTDMSYMFANAYDFNADLSDWTTSQVTDMRSMFHNAFVFNQDLSGWDTSQVTDMSQMFGRASAFNQDLSKWNTSQVTNMKSLFWMATAFNGDVSAWDTRRVTDMLALFYDASVFNQDLSAWDTSQVTEMSLMFWRNNKFNQDLSAWDTRQVTGMRYMFSHATAFKGDISGWVTREVTDMSNMFSNANAFCADITGWKIKSGAITSNMFIAATSFQRAYDCVTLGGTANSGPPNLCVIRPCDASSAPSNGAVGNCTNSVAVGLACQPTCNAGYAVSGASQCKIKQNAVAVLDAANCNVCPAGKFCVAGSADPIACAEKDADGKQQHCPAGSAGALVCAAGSYCTTSAQTDPCPAGSWCAEGVTVPSPCEASMYCAEGSSAQGLCPEGYFCVDASQQSICPSGSWCAEGVTEPTACEDGSRCPKGSTAQTQCPAGFYCTDNGDSVKCPIGSYCVAGSMAPTACAAKDNCPAGSTAHPLQLKVDLSIMLGIGVVDFATNYQDVFRDSVAEWLGSSVQSQDVAITCMCHTNCTEYAGVTPVGTACRTTAAARSRSILQDFNTTEVVYEVLVGSATEEQSVTASAVGENSTSDLQSALTAHGFPADVLLGTDLAHGADVEVDNGNAGFDATGPTANADLTSDEMFIGIILGLVCIVGLGAVFFATLKRPWATEDEAAMERTHKSDKMPEHAPASKPADENSLLGGKKYAVFITHDWGSGTFEELERDNHARAAALNRALTAAGVPTWFDEEKMQGDVNIAMVKGLEDSALVLVCVTKRYMEKVSGHNTADNCFKEFSYAESAHGSTKMLPVVMEPRMRQNKLWTGLLGMHLGRSLYVNFTDDAQLDLAVRDAQVNILGWIDKQLGTKFRDILPSEKR